MSEETNSEEDRIFNGLWNDKDYVNVKLNATKAAAAHAPFLTRLATAVDIRCGGSLGTRSVRKQMQALLHFAIGNQKLRINANTLVPSTSALVITGTVGAGKSIYHKLFEQVVGLMTEATNELDKQIHEANPSH